MKRPSYQTLKVYETLNAADSYGLGYVVDNVVYLAFTNRLLRSMLYLEQASKKRGLVIRMRLTARHIKRLQCNAIAIGTIDDLQGNNKGIAFERLVYKAFNQEYHGHNTTPFWVDGDITINGQKIQLKYGQATITTYKTLARHKAV